MLKQNVEFIKLIEKNFPRIDSRNSKEFMG